MEATSPTTMRERGTRGTGAVGIVEEALEPVALGPRTKSRRERACERQKLTYAVAERHNHSDFDKVVYYCLHFL